MSNIHIGHMQFIIMAKQATATQTCAGQNE
jgi:glycerol-3-phosphate cytidylyltransferase-like family protein